MIAATNGAIETKQDALKKMLNVIYFTSKQFMSSPTAIEEVSKRFNQKIEDVEQWFYATEWSLDDEISHKMLMNVVHTLHFAGIIDKKVEVESLCFRV